MPDLLALTMTVDKPALSATSDKPIVQAPAAAEPKPGPEAKLAAEAPPAESKPAAEPVSKPEPAPVAAEAPELDLSAIQQDAALVRSAEEANAKDKKPARSEFRSQEAFDDALISWSTRKAMRNAQADAAKERLAEGDRQRTQAVARDFHESTAKFAKQKTDFSQVALNPTLPVTESMAAAIIASGNGPEVIYHLGQHPELAAKISKQPWVRQQVEIGKLAAKLSATPQTRPKPVTPRLAVPVQRELSMHEYAARRAKELAAGKRPSDFFGRVVR